MLKTIVINNIFAQTIIILWTEISKEQHIFKIEIIYILNVFTVTYV